MQRQFLRQQNRTHLTRYRRWCYYPYLFVVLLIMTACSAAQDQATDLLVSPAGGGISPESVAENFFEDLRSALQDPSLSSEVTQSFWVERLASYFAPSERDAQSIALRASLARFARDRERLGEDEILTLELTFDRPVKVADNGQRAMVQIPNGTLHMLIIRMTERGPLTIYEQPIGLDQVIGNPGGLVPTIRISDRWFLTEG